MLNGSSMVRTTVTGIVGSLTDTGIKFAAR